MATQLFYLDLILRKRVAGVDQDAARIEKEDYESSNILERTLSLTATVNEVICNTAGTYLLVADVDDATAQVTLYVDGQALTFRDIFCAVISGTTVSMTSTVSTDVAIQMIEIV